MFNLLVHIVQKQDVLRVCGAPIQVLIYKNNHNLNVFLKSSSLLQINRKLLKINELLQELMFAATELRNIKEAEEREEGQKIWRQRYRVPSGAKSTIKNGCGVRRI